MSCLFLFQVEIDLPTLLSKELGGLQNPSKPSADLKVHWFCWYLHFDLKKELIQFDGHDIFFQMEWFESTGDKL